MTAVTGTKPHPIFLAGRWVESPDPLVVANPADDSAPAGSTFNATSEQYEEAVEAAVAAFPVTRELPAYARPIFVCLDGGLCNIVEFGSQELVQFHSKSVAAIHAEIIPFRSVCLNL